MNLQAKSMRPISAASRNTVENHTPPPAAPDWLAFAPAIFVILWSTGFIGMRLGTPYAEPFTFMAVRMAIVVVILLAATAVFRAPWPRGRTEVFHAVVAGLLVHATYLSGVLYAISLKLPLAFTALIAGLQPILTGVVASVILSERLRPIHWLGMLLGCLGVVTAVSPTLARGEVGVPALLCAAVALLGIAAGTVYQKRFCSGMDLRTGGAIQFSATGVVLFGCAAAFETRTIYWAPQFVFALGWLALVLSIGAISLLYVMIRHGATARVASLFFLTPSVTAIMAYLLFDEALSGWAICGLVVSALGVALVTRK